MQESIFYRVEVGGRSMVKLANLITEIYANGAKLVVEGSRLGIKGNPPQRIYNEVAEPENKKKLLEALTGDPLSGPGWEARTALYKEALRWLDEKTPEEARDKVTAALCREKTAEALNTIWIDGTFEEFRAALKKYVRTGLEAARSREEQKMEVRA
jgi:hypothetical protein